MLCITFMSFSFPMYADRVVFFEYFLFENESLWAYNPYLKVPSVAPIQYFVVLFFVIVNLYTTFLAVSLLKAC